MNAKTKERLEFLAVVCVAVVLILGARAFFLSGEDTPETAAIDQRSFDNNQRVAPVEERGDGIRLTLNRNQRSEPIRVGSNQCIQWWDDGADITNFRVEVAGFDGNDWIANEEFLKQKRAGLATYNFPAWYRFVGTRDGEVRVSYQILRGLCP